MKVKVIKKNSLQLDFFLKKNVPVIIQKNFFSKNICKKIIKYCIDLSRNNPQRKLTQKKEFYSIDVNPQGAITQRILRKFMLGKNFLKKFNKVNELINFQYNKILKPKKKFTPEIAVVHYPRGGVFCRT